MPTKYGMIPLGAIVKTCFFPSVSRAFKQMRRKPNTIQFDRTTIIMQDVTGTDVFWKQLWMFGNHLIKPFSIGLAIIHDFVVSLLFRLGALFSFAVLQLSSLFWYTLVEACWLFSWRSFSPIMPHFFLNHKFQQYQENLFRLIAAGGYL